MGGKSSTPDAPDYNQIAHTQGGENRDTALFNSALANPNLVTPYGSYSYSFGPSVHMPGSGGGVTGEGGGSNPASGYGSFFGDLFGHSGSTPTGSSGLDIPRPTATFTLSPEQQQLFNQNQSNQALAGRETNQAIGDIGDLMQGGALASRKRVEDALYREGARYLDPRYSQMESKLNTDLANEGVFRGNTAFNQAQGNFNDQRDRAYGDLTDRAILQGGAEQSRLFSQAGQNANLLNSLFGYRYPFSNVGANSGGGAAPADLAGAAQNQYQAALNAANAHNAASSNMFGDLLGAGTNAAMLFALA